MVHLLDLSTQLHNFVLKYCVLYGVLQERPGYEESKIRANLSFFFGLFRLNLRFTIAKILETVQKVESFDLLKSLAKKHSFNCVPKRNLKINFISRKLIK